MMRTEFGTVVVQSDICNGCGTCVAGCPFGVVERRSDGTVAPTTRDGERKGEQPLCPRGHRAEVHALLRPAAGERDPGLRQDLSDDVDLVRRSGGDGRQRRTTGRSCTRPA